jgi:3D-(3,5/4)-trihydroxycyclohexane-1,2-dione acylhydrolase (decyclizing)
VKFIGINVAGHDAYKQGALPVLADAREALTALTSAAAEAGIKPDAGYQKDIASTQAEWAQNLQENIYIDHPDEAMSQARLIQTLNEEAQDGDCIIAAAGNPPGDLHQLWDVSRGAACYIEFGYSCMGWEIPAGLGARMSQKHNEVYVYVGDGTYLMNPMELMTAMQEGLKITVVISENHGYQIIWSLQMLRAGREFGNEFRARDPEANRLEGAYLNIDFAKNAESLGARTWHVNTPEELRGALREARDETRTCVIVCETEKHRYLPPTGVWWDIATAEATNDPMTRKLREGYEGERRTLQRFHY